MFKGKSQSSQRSTSHGASPKPEGGNQSRFRNFKRSSRPSSQSGRGSSHSKGRNFAGTTLTMNQLVNKVQGDTATPEAEKHDQQHQFADFPIDPRLLKNITDKGYVTPTPIQDLAIPQLLEGRDLIGLANTGTGKTAAFLIPLINKILADRTQKALILAPTRELAQQINEEFRGFTKGMNLFSLICIGGTNMHEQMRRIRMPFNVLIGTPGRILDLQKRKALYLDRFQNVVLDEADRMLDMGFINDIKFICGQLPKQRHTMFFTATFQKQVEALVHDFLVNPVKISVKKRETSANIEQDVIQVTDKSKKLDVLIELLKKPGFERVLVFGRTKFGVEKITKALHSKGFKVDSIHGNKSQNYRMRALQSFKNGSIRILIATDVAARGLDISNVSHVINYDLPANYEDYVHRIGRTGRADQKGIALSLVSH